MHPVFLISYLSYNLFLFLYILTFPWLIFINSLYSLPFSFPMLPFSFSSPYSIIPYSLIVIFCYFSPFNITLPFCFYPIIFPSAFLASLCVFRSHYHLIILCIFFLLYPYLSTFFILFLSLSLPLSFY